MNRISRSIKRSVQAQASHVPPDVPVRHMDFSFESANLVRYVYDNDPFYSALLMTFSAVIPHGERFFIESVRNYRGQIRDARLQDRVTGFIGQEAMHGKEHDTMNEAYDAMGFPLLRIDSLSQRGFKWFARLAPKRMQLAFTVAIEHLTAIISEYTFRRPEIQAKYDPEALKFTLWHMVEETEHKAVAFDVYEATGGGYLTRISTMIVSLIGLGLPIAIFHLWIIAADRSVGTVLRHPRGIAGVYGRRGLIMSLAPAFFDFFRPSFHPSQHDTDALLVQMHERLFSERGELAAQIKKTIVPRRRMSAAT